MKKMEDYADILDIDHYEPKYHCRMDKLSRAAQFAPFAALSGYAEAINESGRIVDQKKELSEEGLFDINKKINYIKNQKKLIEILVIYFITDLKKEGGKYIEYRGLVRMVNDVEKYLQFKDKKKIYFKDILSISICE